MRYQFVVIGYGEANAGILPFTQHIDVTLKETKLSPADEQELAESFKDFFGGDEVLSKELYDSRIEAQETAMLPFDGDEEEIEEPSHDSNGMA
jgi:hypothetical protein